MTADNTSNPSAEPTTATASTPPAAPYTGLGEPAYTVKEGSISIKIYKVSSPNSSDGHAYRFKYVEPGTGKTRNPSRTTLDAAKLEAKRVAKLLSRGVTEHVSAADVSELIKIREEAQKRGYPAVSAIAEWGTAHDIAGPTSSLISIAKEHAATVADGAHERVTHAEAWKQFIEVKNKRGKGTRTYGSKSLMIMNGLGADIMLDTMKSEGITRWADSIEDPTTRNDLLKRLGTMLKWAKRKGLFPLDRAIPTDNVDRAPPKDDLPGIVTPMQLKRSLEYIRAHHPHYIAALALASLGGERGDEIHGKRSDAEVPRATMERQRWEHVQMGPQDENGECGHFFVTVAKKRTPSYRMVPILPPLAAWLAIAPRTEDDPYVCNAGAMERIRMILRYADADLGFPKTTVKIAGKDVVVNDIPSNSWRHAFISHRLVLVGIVQTASEAGNSPPEIQRSYRVPVPRTQAEAYFKVFPDPVPPAAQPTEPSPIS